VTIVDDATAVMTVADADKKTAVVPVLGHQKLIPTYASSGSAGADLRAALDEAVELPPGERLVVPTGIRIELPAGMEGQVRPRSGLAVRHGLTVLNAPGTIDSDYRGEIQVPLVNLGSQTVTIQPGMRIAQLVIAPYIQAIFRQTDHLSTTERGSAGFGSTGTG